MEKKICLGCMRQIPADAQRCPYCDFSVTDPRPTQALPLQSMLDEQYVIGAVSEVNNGYLSYVGYDLKLKKPCIIKEFFPSQLSGRALDGVQLQVYAENLAHYKAVLTDFNELYSQMSLWEGLSHVEKPYALLQSNNTAYMVFDKWMGTSLESYLQMRGGNLSWTEARLLFEPLLRELTMIHNDGYLHRGICPQHLQVLEGGRLFLTSFSIQSSGFGQEELEAQLPDGYAAPEQYTGTQHGQWTDVYGMCAVLYRVLTGIDPLHPMQQEEGEGMVSPHRVNPLHPRTASDAIMMGLNQDITERLQNFEELQYALLHGVSGMQTAPITESIPVVKRVSQDTAVTGLFTAELDPKKVAKEESKKLDGEDEGYKGGDEEEKKALMPTWKKILIGSIPVVILIILFLYEMMIGFGGTPGVVLWGGGTSSETSSLTTSTTSSLPTSETTSTTSQAEAVLYTMPKLVGQSYDDFDPHLHSMFVFENPIFQYNDSYEDGVIFQQSVEVGTQVPEGTRITLYVSNGPSSVVLPEISDYTAQQYSDLLFNKYGITSTIEREYSDTVAAGNVVRTTPAAGTAYDLTHSVPVIIYQSIGKEPVIAPSEPTVPSTPTESTPATPSEPTESEPGAEIPVG